MHASCPSPGIDPGHHQGRHGPPGVGITPSFTADGIVPGCTLHSEARVMPDPPLCAGYRIAYTMARGGVEPRDGFPNKFEPTFRRVQKHTKASRNDPTLTSTSGMEFPWVKLRFTRFLVRALRCLRCLRCWPTSTAHQAYKKHAELCIEVVAFHQLNSTCGSSVRSLRRW